LIEDPLNLTPSELAEVVAAVERRADENHRDTERLEAESKAATDGET
jgi:hypothetical protein